MHSDLSRDQTRFISQAVLETRQRRLNTRTHLPAMLRQRREEAAALRAIASRPGPWGNRVPACASERSGGWTNPAA